MRKSVWKGLLPLALAAVLTGCGTPGAETASPQPLESAAVSAPENTPTPTVKPIPTDGPYVYTDYSQLEDNSPRPDRYVRWYGEFTDHLIPSPDYGPLIPFSGDGAEEAWGTTDYAAQGLMTLDGKVVVDPVYASVTQLCSGGDMEFGRPDVYYPAFLLSRYTGEGSKGDPNNLFNAYNDVSSRLCALDGSWVTEEYRFSYNTLCYGNGVQDGAVFALRDERYLVLLDVSTGKEIFSVDLDGLSENTIRDNILNYVHYGDGRIVLNTYLYGYNTPYLRCWEVNGNEIFFPDDVDGAYGFSEGLCPARRTGGEGYAWGYLGLDGQWAIPPRFTHTSAFSGGVALVGGHAHTLIDKEGNVLYETPVYDRCQKTGDYWYFTGYSGDAGLVLDKQGNEVASPLLHGGVVHVLDHGWAAMDNPDGSLTLAKGEKSWLVPEEWGYIWRDNVTEDIIYLGCWATDEEKEAHWGIWRPESGRAPTAFSGNFDSLRTDPVTGERYCVIYDDYSSGRYHITDLSGKTLFDGLSGWPRLYAGRCLTKTTGSNGKTVELRDQSGAVLFRRTWEDPFG